MAKFTDVNNTPADGSEAMFIWKELMKSAGGTIPRSSDGTTYNAGGDQITIPGAGAGGMANNSAWFDIVLPDGREWSVQRGTTNLVWRVKVSALDNFGGGSPGITQVSSAADEQVLKGAGTDAAPTFATLFAADGTYRWHCIARDDLTGPVGNEVMPFWAFATVTATGLLRTAWMQEPMDVNSYPALVGTRAAPTSGDPDPVVYECAYGASGGMWDCGQGFTKGWADNASNEKRFWFGMNGTNGLTEAWEQAPGFAYLSDNSPARVGPPGNMGSNPYSGDDEGFPILVGRAASEGTSIGTKGFTQYIRMKGGVRDYPDTINLATDGYVYVEQSLIPFEDGTPPLL